MANNKYYIVFLSCFYFARCSFAGALPLVLLFSLFFFFHIAPNRPHVRSPRPFMIYATVNRHCKSSIEKIINIKWFSSFDRYGSDGFERLRNMMRPAHTCGGHGLCCGCYFFSAIRAVSLFFAPMAHNE